MDWKRMSGIIAAAVVAGGIGGGWLMKSPKEDPMVKLAKEVQDMRSEAERRAKEEENRSANEKKLLADKDALIKKATEDAVAAVKGPYEKEVARIRMEAELAKQAKEQAAAMIAEARKEAERALQDEARRRAEEEKRINDAVEKRIKDLLPKSINRLPGSSDDYKFSEKEKKRLREVFEKDREGARGTLERNLKWYWKGYYTNNPAVYQAFAVFDQNTAKLREDWERQLLAKK